MALSKINITVKSSKPWLHVAVATDDVICKGLLAVFHKDEQFHNEPLPHVGFDRDPIILYKQLNQPIIYNKLLKLFNKKIIKQDQWDLLFPTNIETHSTKFDITLLGILIKNLNGIKTLNRKLKLEELDVNDETILGFVIKALVFRNSLYHFGSITAMTPADENSFWNELTDIAAGLKFQGKVNEYHTLSLDPDSKLMINAYTTWCKTQIDITNHKISNLAKSQHQDQKNIQNLEQELNDLRVALATAKTVEQCFEVFNKINELRLDILSHIEDLEFRIESGEQAVRINTEKIENNKEDIEIIKQDHIHIKDVLTAFESNSDDFVVLTVLGIVAVNIENDWKRLSIMLDINQMQSNMATLQEKHNDRELIMQAFDSLNNKVTWKKLRRCLLELKRIDLVELIEKERIITQGDYHCSDIFSRYKRQIENRYQNWTQKEPIKTVDGPTHRTVGRMDLYVELVVGEWEKAQNFDLEHFQRRNLAKSTKLERQDIIKLSDKCVLARGIAGIGKTSLMNSLVYDWSMQSCLNDFELVVKLECRELNVMRDLNSWKDILCRWYPNLFNEMVLKHVAEKNVLIILDGIDEYAYFDELKKIMHGNMIGQSPANALYDLFLAVLPCWHILICGRPAACEEIAPNLDDLYSKCKRVEVTGFNEIGLTEYIQKFNFMVNTSKDSLQQTLEDNQRLKSFMCIPAYAYTICSVFDREETLLEQLNTFTRLNLALLLVHLRDFMKKSNCSLMELCSDLELMSVVHDLAEFAFKSMDERRIIFEEEEMFQCKYLTEMERTGIFVKCEYGEDGCVYQFRHLILQELLCAIHIYRNYHIEVFTQQLKMKNVCFMFAGLLGCHQNLNCSKYLSNFVSALSTEKYIDEKSRSAALLKMIQNNDDCIDTLQIIYEFHKETNLRVNCYLENIEFVFTIYNKSDFFKALYFLKHFKARKVSVYIFIRTLTIQLCTELVKVIEFARCNQYANHNEITSINTSNKEMSLKSFDILNCTLNEGILTALSPILPLIEEFRFQTYTINTKDWQPFIDSVISSDVRNELNLKTMHVYLHHVDDLVHLSQIVPFIEILNVVSFVNETENNNVFGKGWKSFRKYILDSNYKGVLKLRKLVLAYFRLNYDSIRTLSSIFPLLEIVDLRENSNISNDGWKSITQYINNSHNNGELMLRELIFPLCASNDGSIIILSSIFPLLQKIDLKLNSEITKDSWESIKQYIINSYHNGELKLREISIKNCNLNDDGIIILSCIFPLLQKVNLSENKNITKDGWESVTKSIIKAHNNEKLQLRELCLEACNLNDDEVLVLSPLIPLLEKIDLVLPNAANLPKRRNVNSYQRYKSHTGSVVCCSIM